VLSKSEVNVSNSKGEMRQADQTSGVMPYSIVRISGATSQTHTLVADKLSAAHVLCKVFITARDDTEGIG
jgi:hypothetical protein